MVAPNTLPHLHALILAGGSGTRFWPLSRKMAPKQMLTLFGDEGSSSLMGDTVARIRPFSENIHVLSSEFLADETKNHLLADGRFDDISLEILAEPAPKNTAFAIALAAAHLHRIDPEAVMIVLPSDHILRDDAAWSQAVICAYKAAGQGALVTFGLTPDRPETGFGYILPGDPIAGDSGAHHVTTFVEKPDFETAKRYVDEGYLWNSGMFMMKAGVVLEEFSKTGLVGTTPTSQSNVLIRKAAEDLAAQAVWTDDHARKLVADVPSEPFDKAVLEVSDNVVVVPATLTWSDVGSLSALDSLTQSDSGNNRSIGRGVIVDSHNVTTYSDDGLVATLGLDNIVVVNTPDATLVADKARAQDVRLVVDALNAAGAEEATRSRRSARPWGAWTLLIDTPTYKVKRIDVAPGKKLSLQSHKHRSEHWIVVEGCAVVEQGENTSDLQARRLEVGESTYLPAGMVHRLSNETEHPLAIIEVAVGSYLGEDDIVRFEDDWSR